MRARRLRNSPVLIGSHGGPMTNSELKAALGVDPKRHWPDQGIPPQQVQGFTVQVHPKASRISRRAVVQCSKCQRWLCAGHIGQHVKGSLCQ